MRAQITNDNQQATMAESMAELEIVPRPEVTAAISDDPHDLSDVSSEDEEEGGRGIHSYRTRTRCTGTRPRTGTSCTSTCISPTGIGTHLRHQWNSIWYSSAGTHLRQRPKPVQHQILQSWVPVVPVDTGRKRACIATSRY